MNLIEKLGKLIPCSPAGPVDWDAVGALLASTCFSRMRGIPQNPRFHGEGDVLTHTRMVCEALNGMEKFHALPDRPRTELFLAALLHDIGKAVTTRQENGVWISPNHAPAGSRLAREFLWKEEGFCGCADMQNFRETVCALIRYHMTPEHLTDLQDPGRKLRGIAAAGELAPDLNLDMLCMLAEADAMGRIAEDREEILTQVRLCRMAAEEAGCLAGPYSFTDAHTRYAYLSGRNVQPDQRLYDETWGAVILLSGLPGTGKDTWIRDHCPDLPVVSLDAVRRALHVSPAEGQSGVVQEAREQARAFLRRKQPFIWNATNISREMREKETSLFERYGASVRIVYLETGWEQRCERNAGRKEAVPEPAVAGMLRKTVPPMPDEAQTVEWICT